MEQCIILNLGYATPAEYRESKRILIKLSEDKSESINALQEDRSVYVDPTIKEDHAKQLSKLVDDRKHINSMISDCQLVIEKLNRGFSPAAGRRMSRLSMLQRETLTDPKLMQSYIRNSFANSPFNLNDWERFRLEDAMYRLSDRERECYLLAIGECYSFADIAELFGINKGSVQTNVERARKKITDDVETSLLLIEYCPDKKKAI
jgi:RNA polymerase sigma factor (sigma-70 family)